MTTATLHKGHATDDDDAGRGKYHVKKQTIPGCGTRQLMDLLPNLLY